MTSDCSFQILERHFAKGRTARKNVCAYLENASINIGECVQRYVLPSKILSSIPFCAIFVKMHFSKWNNSIFKSLFAHSEPTLNASLSVFFATLDIASLPVPEKMRPAFYQAIFCIIARSLAWLKSSWKNLVVTGVWPCFWAGMDGELLFKTLTSELAFWRRLAPLVLPYGTKSSFCCSKCVSDHLPAA